MTYAVSLRTSLILLLASASLFSFTIVASIVLALRLPQIEASTRSQAQRLARETARLVDAQFDGVEGQLKGLAQGLRSGRSPASLQPALEALAMPGATFHELLVVDDQGRLVAGTQAGGPLPLAAAGAFLQQHGPSALHLYQDARQAAQAGKPDAPLWRDEALADHCDGPCASFALVAGRWVVLGTVAQARLLGPASQAAFSAEAQTMVVDMKGHRLTPSQPPFDTIQELDDIPAVRSFHDVQGDPVQVRLQDRDYLLGGVVMPRTGWLVLAWMPSGMRQVNYRATVFIVSLGYVVALMLSLALAPVWARRLSRPFRVIAGNAHLIAAGKSPTPGSDVGPVREFRELARDLDRMVIALREREAEVVRSEGRLKSSLEYTPLVAIQWYDVEGRIQYWNSASTALYGYTRDDALGTCITERPLMFLDREQARTYVSLLQDIAQSGQPFGPAEFELRHEDGQAVTVLATTFAIAGDDGAQIFVCMDVDITARRRMEAQLRDLNAELEMRVDARTEELRQANVHLEQTLRDLQQAQQYLVESAKLAALGNLVAGVAHELNTPIGNGLMAVSTLDERLQDFRRISRDGLRYSDLQRFADAVDNACAISMRNLQRAATLLASFKQVAVDQASSQRRRFELREVVDEVLLTLQPTLRKGHIRVTTEVQDGLMLDSYPGAWGQVLTNLLSNAAMHAFEPGQEGTVTIRAQALTDDEIQLSVCDDGRGIGPGLEQRIFEPFYTTRMGSGGSGLGLHIVYNAVTRVLGGQVQVRHVVPHGLCIEMRIPRIAPGHDQDTARAGGSLTPAS